MSKANKHTTERATEEEVKRTTERAADEEVVVETEETKRTTDKEGDGVKVPFYKRKWFWAAAGAAGAVGVATAVYVLRNSIPGVSAVVSAVQETESMASIDEPIEVEAETVEVNVAAE